MNREDIIRIAREAGAVFPADGSYHRFESEENLERFAALVASAEREECERGYLRLQSLMEIRETQPNKPCCLAEREACAKLCDDLDDDIVDGLAGWQYAEAIRARGDNK